MIKLAAYIASQSGKTLAVAFRDLETGKECFINADQLMQAIAEGCFG